MPTSRSSVRRAIGCSARVALSAALATSVARADWPVSRHDVRRTGTAVGKSNITRPLPYWKAYVGGELHPLGVQVGDVDGDASIEVVYAAAGRVVAAQPAGEPRWTSPLGGFHAVDAIVDLDGNGSFEVVAHSSSRAIVLNGKTGTALWMQPAGDMGTIGGVRLGDLDGDGSPELLLRECGCCGAQGTVSGIVYSFAAGASNPTTLWEFPAMSSCSDGNAALVISDVDGDGDREVVTTGSTSASVLDGSTGAVLATAPVPGTAAQFNACAPANIDGKPGNELVCFGTPPTPPPDDQRRVYALRYDSAPKKLEVLWTKQVAPYLGGDLKVADPLADLDGDGKLEIVLSTSQALNVWETKVLDAATGAEVAKLPDRVVAGHIQLAKGALLVTSSAGAAVTGWAYDPQLAQPLSLAWTLTDSRALAFPDPWRQAESGAVLSERLVAPDLNGDGVADVVVQDLAIPNGQQGLSAWSLAEQAPKKLAAHALPPGVGLARAWGIASGTQHRIALGRDDGHLVLLDKALAPTNAVSVELPGIRTGGYYAHGGWRDHHRGPVVGKLDSGGAERIIAVDSRRALVALDASKAAFTSPPLRLWARTSAYAPAIVPGLAGGNPGVACLALHEPVTTPPQDLVLALDGAGKETWAQPVPRAPFNDVLPATLDADGIPDLLLQHGDPANTLLRSRAISGATGVTLWSSSGLDPGCGRQPVGFSVADWDGDGVDDLVFQAQGTRVLSGKDGGELSKGGSSACYALPTIWDLDNSTDPEVVLSGTNVHVQAWSHDLQTQLWQTDADDSPFPYGALVDCPVGPILAEGSWKFPARMRLIQTTGAGAGTGKSVVLAAGKVWASENAAIAAGATLGGLGSASGHQNLNGGGAPIAVVGSSDGWLYALDPCSGKLMFSHDFGAPVGNVVFGDTDGNGLDEIVVSVADGYLYGLEQADVDPPKGVLDTDPEHGVTGADVDEIVTKGTLSGAWEAGTDATGFECAVVTADLTTFVAPWAKVGKVTSHSFHGLSLSDGAKYFFAVRAVKGGAVSPDSLSDAVVVHLEAPEPAPDAGLDAGDAADDRDLGPDAHLPTSVIVAGGGCDCRSEPSPRAPFGAKAQAFLTLLAAAVRRRRNRHVPSSASVSRP